MDDPAIDEEEAAPRFLLGAGPARADAVAAVVAALRPAGLIVRAGWDRGLLDVVRGHGIALLAEDDVDLAAELDGLHLSNSSRVPDMRAALDRTKANRLILGVDVGLSRHDAMVAGEEGADYVAFGQHGQSADEKVLDLISWWREVTVMPCLGYALDAETVEKLAGIGTEFIGVSSAVWDDPEGPEAAARKLSAAIAKS
ncbi:MAG: thiamine phosphate synthase [Alphaproteobacteria bacterium]